MRPILPRKIIAEAVERDLGPVSEWRLVSGGEESQTFGIRLGSEDIILRVNRSATGFHKDEFCYRRFASSSLPIPEIMSIGMVNDHAYCVSRRAAGTTLQDLPPTALPTLVETVGSVMQAIADTPLHETKGFGRFDTGGIGEHASWRDFIAAVADPQRYDWKHHEPLVDTRWVKQHLRLLLELTPQCPETRRLVHGDFGSNNVLTNGVVITGVIDWSEALFGDPLYDIANIFFWRPWLACMEIQARHFERRRPGMIDNILTLRCYELRIGLEQVYESVRAEDTQNLRWAMTRCEEVAADLSLGSQ
jgi:hygromycin-B 4-O-kinase